jgi:hypothetical protein
MTTPSRARSRRILLGLGLLTSTASLAAEPAGPAAQAFDIQPGLWSITRTTIFYGTSVTVLKDLMDNLWRQQQQTLANIKASPSQRQQVRAQWQTAENKQLSDLSKPRIQRSKVCARPQELQKGNILNLLPHCPVLSFSVGTAERSLRCGPFDQNLSAQYRFERISPQHVSGSAELVQRQNANPPIGNANYQIRQSFDAVFLADSCDQSRQQIAAFIKRGADPTVLSFFPWRPGQPFGRFHQLLDYNWTTSRQCGNAIPGGCVISPAVSYVEGLPGAARGNDPYNTYFDGTDGQAIYVSLGMGGSVPTLHYRIERSGKPTRIDAVPKGLRGGNSSQAF